MKRIAYSLLALGFFQSTNVMAQQPNFSYNTFGLQFGQSDVSFLDENSTDMGVSASLSLNERVFAFADYGRMSADDANGLGIDIDYDTLSAGVGLVFPVKSGLDMTTKLSYINTSAEASNGLELDDSGYGIAVGANYWLSSEFDASFAISYRDLDDSGSDTAYAFGIGYWPAKEHRVGLSFETADDVDSIAVNYRISQ